MPTVREIAQHAGVSTSTVSLVLNNKPGVSEQMRDTVMNAVKELNEQTPHSARIEAPVKAHRTPSNGDSLSLLVLHPPILESSYVFRQVFQGIQSESDANNCHLRLISNEARTLENHMAQVFITDDALRPDGILIFGARTDEPILDMARKFNIPCVVLGRAASRYNVSGIERDEQRHAFDATHHLIEQGHERIAFIGEDKDYDFAINREQGYKDALEESNIGVRSEWIINYRNTDAIEELLKLKPHITAAIMVNDTAAEATLPIFEAHNISIPDDIAVLSFDDTDFARAYNPPLTSVSFYHYQEGQWAIRILLDHIQAPFLERTVMTFGAHLIKRASTSTNA